MGLQRSARLAAVVINNAQPRPGHGEVGVQFDGLAVMSFGLRQIQSLFVLHIAQSEGAEGFERWVVAWPKGVSSFWIELRDSPSRARMAVATLPMASITWSLSAACACSLAMSSPVAVFCAVSVMM